METNRRGVAINARIEAVARRRFGDGASTPIARVDVAAGGRRVHCAFAAAAAFRVINTI